MAFAPRDGSPIIARVIARPVTALLLGAVLAACRGALPAPETAQRHAPAAAVAPAPVAVTPAPAPRAPADNRDPHGDRDVARYVARLQDPGRVEHLRIGVVLEKLAPAADAVIGDLGCGPGLFALAFSRACPEGLVYACDVEPAQLDALRERIRAEEARNVVPVLASPDDPHFPPGRFDIVFVADTYHHLRDRVTYLRRLREAFKPGGRLVLLEYKPGDLPVGPPAAHKLEAGVMERELGEAGYKRVERFDTHPWHDFEVWRPGHAWESRD